MESGTETRSRLILNGRSREPQLRALMEKFGDLLNPGDDVTHEMIEAVLGEVRTSARYRGLMVVWKRKMLVEKRKHLEARNAVGYHVCVGDERMEDVQRDIKRSTRALAAGVMKAEQAPAEELSDAGRRQREYMLTRGAARLQELRRDRKEITLKLPEVGKKT